MRVLDMNELECVAGGKVSFWEAVTAAGTTFAGLTTAAAGAYMLKAGVTTTLVIFGGTIGAPAAVILLGVAAAATGAVVLGIYFSQGSGC